MFRGSQLIKSENAYLGQINKIMVAKKLKTKKLRVTMF